MDMGTSDVDIGTTRKDEPISRVPNTVLRELRASQGWGRPRLAKELHRFCLAKKWSSPGESNIAKQIYRLETGRVKVPDEFYAQLYCQFYQKSSDELFGCVKPIAAPAPTYELRSHKFIPLYVGVEAVERLRTICGMTAATGQWFECFRAPFSGYGDSCHLYVWPFGVAMFHLVEDLTPASVAEVSVWRHASYIKDMAWAEGQIKRLAGCEARNEIYVLGAYWVGSVARKGVALTNTAIRILCVPEVLIEHAGEQQAPSRARAELVEQALLRDGFDDAGIEDFGVQGISIALASWSGVVYYPLARDRALTEQDLVRCELAVQSAWSYCSYIRHEVEQGRDPAVPAIYGWRFMRGLRSRLTTERPKETPQHRSMREAIVKTSGLGGHLAQALEALREIDGVTR